MSRSTQKKNNVITDRNTVLTFGKWKGSSIDELLLDDPQYLLWLAENTEFDLHYSLVEEAEEMLKGNHEFSGYTARNA